jgi:hypothetical protein
MFTEREFSVPFHRETDTKETTKSGKISMLRIIFLSSMEEEITGMFLNFKIMTKL